jgi:predicted amidohydrolase YtcJ
MLTVRALKLYADGALGSYGAALIEPYADDPSTRGLTLTSTDSISYFADQCIEKGFQLSVHAIGDRANHIVLNSYEEAFRRNGTRGSALRFRIEHAQVLDPADINRFASLGVLPVVQPTHCTSDMYWVETRLGPERLRGTYAWHSLVSSGSILPAGSDFPVESNNPLFGFYAAITRQDQSGWPEGGWQPAEKLTREEALKAFTSWAAAAAFEENEKGSLTEGKVADIVVLSNDIMEISPAEILQTTVDHTIVAGRIVYSADAIARVR